MWQGTTGVVVHEAERESESLCKLRSAISWLSADWAKAGGGKNSSLKSFRNFNNSEPE
jgi:hypothetical protein